MPQNKDLSAVPFLHHDRSTTKSSQQSRREHQKGHRKTTSSSPATTISFHPFASLFLEAKELVPIDETTPTMTASSQEQQDQIEKSLFPVLLHDLLEDSEKNDESDIVGWDPSGRCFKVHHKEKFMTKILPRFFKQTKYKSFVRQLNIWGLSCINQGPEKGYYFHTHFVKGKKELCKRMFREKVKGTGQLRGPKKNKKESTSQPAPREHWQSTQTSEAGSSGDSPRSSCSTNTTTSAHSTATTSSSSSSTLRSTTNSGAPAGLFLCDAIGYSMSLCPPSSLRMSESPRVPLVGNVVSDWSPHHHHYHYQQTPGSRYQHTGNAAWNNDVATTTTSAFPAYSGTMMKNKNAEWNVSTAADSEDYNQHTTVLRTLQQQLLMLCKERDAFLTEQHEGIYPVTTTSINHEEHDCCDGGKNNWWFYSLEENKNFPAAAFLEDALFVVSADSPIEEEKGESPDDHDDSFSEDHDDVLLMTAFEKHEDLFEPRPLAVGMATKVSFSEL